MSLWRLWQLSVRVTPEAEDAVAELVARLTARPVSICHSVEEQRSTVTAYFTRKTELARPTRVALQRNLLQLVAGDLETGRCRVSFRPIRRLDWAESWKKHFHPFTVGQRLLVKPSWSRQRAKPGQAVVILDPGLCFGTGQHPTTRFCLRQIVAARKPGTAQSFLDIGTGSGILAIAAAKLGFDPVRGFDQDPEAVRIASDNAARNQVRNRYNPFRQELTGMPMGKGRGYDMVCANLLADLLITAKGRILGQVRPSGCLVLAGILAREFGAVQGSYSESGLRLIADAVDGEWRSGCFVRPL